MKKCFLLLSKFCISFILALTILSGFCLFYYNPPIATPQPNGFTNHRFESNSFWCNLTEGGGWGRINNIGYSDRRDYVPNLPTIAFVGSSQVQAMQVPQDKTFVSLSNDLFNNDADANNNYQCLNLGVAGHFFNISASNFEYLAKHFSGTDYIVLEVSSIDYSEEQLDKILAEEFHSDMEEPSTFYKLTQRIPYLRLLAKQLQELKNGANLVNVKSAGVDNLAIYENKMDLILQKLSDSAKANGIQLIILYHFPIKLNADNTAETGNNPKLEEIFEACCASNNIPLINMNEPMIRHFESTYEPSYGFANSRPGVGHLNETGHRLIAYEVYEKINSLTEGN